MYCDRKGTDKNLPDKNLPDKNLREQLREDLYRGAFVRVFCTRSTKNRGVRDVWRTFGGSQDVWQSVTGEGVKIGEK